MTNAKHVIVQLICLYHLRNQPNHDTRFRYTSAHLGFAQTDIELKHLLSGKIVPHHTAWILRLMRQLYGHVCTVGAKYGVMASSSDVAESICTEGYYFRLRGWVSTHAPIGHGKEHPDASLVPNR